MDLLQRYTDKIHRLLEDRVEDKSSQLGVKALYLILRLSDKIYEHMRFILGCGAVELLHTLRALCTSCVHVGRQKVMVEAHDCSPRSI